MTRLFELKFDVKYAAQLDLESHAFIFNQRLQCNFAEILVTVQLFGHFLEICKVKIGLPFVG